MNSIDDNGYVELTTHKGYTCVVMVHGGEAGTFWAWPEGTTSPITHEDTIRKIPSLDALHDKINQRVAAAGALEKKKVSEQVWVFIKPDRFSDHAWELVTIVGINRGMSATTAKKQNGKHVSLSSVGYVSLSSVEYVFPGDVDSKRAREAISEAFAQRKAAKKVLDDSHHLSVGLPTRRAYGRISVEQANEMMGSWLGALDVARTNWRG